jgi:hypothetical protein
MNHEALHDNRLNETVALLNFSFRFSNDIKRRSL